MAEAKQLEELSREFEQTFGEALVSLSLHGRGVALWWPARLVAVLARSDAQTLQRAPSLMARWRKRGFEAPLFLTRQDLKRSLDTFPLELFNLGLAVQPLSGADLFSGLNIEPAMLRLQCERELKGRAVALRRAYAASTLREELLGLVAGSLPLMLAVFRGLVHLAGGAAPPLEPQALLEAASGQLKLDAGLFGRLLAVSAAEAKKPSQEALHGLLGDYLAECERLAALADGLAAGQ